MLSNNIEITENEISKLRAENEKLKKELSYQSRKHAQWKSLAMCFHDSLWKLIDEYVLNDTK